MLSICASITMNLSNDWFLYSAARTVVSALHSAAYNGTAGAEHAAVRGELGGRPDRLAEALALIMEERDESDDASLLS